MNARATPSALALEGGEHRLTHAELENEADRLAEQLQAAGTRVLATLMDNSPAWVVADLAAARAGVVHVPLPLFFTPGQVAHVVHAAGVDTVLTLPPFAAAHWPRGAASGLCVAGQGLSLVRLQPAAVPPMPEGTAKITFTSGTTGAPKGVCLGADAMRRVAEGLVVAMAPLDVRRHLCALPFAVLLENIAGVMAPLLNGATCITLPLAQVGLSGSSGFDAARFHACTVAHQPHSLILLPQMLRAWCGHLLQSGERAPGSLKLVAVGGAAVGAKLLNDARALGIPVFEGYGLSEGASVQTLNLPGHDRGGTAGRALPHARLRVAPDGEVEVAGSLFLGYLGDAAAPPRWWPTGDLGWIDAEGYLHVSGRKKHLLITGFGRNVAPEWIETALRGEHAIAQAVVFGEAQPALSAVLWPVRADATDAQLQAAVDAANATLPDYARILRWVRGRANFDAASGMATANGRAQRASILQLHADALGIAAAS